MAWASLIIAMMLWGSSFVGAKFALQSFTPEQAVGIRLLLGAVGNPALAAHLGPQAPSKNDLGALEVAAGDVAVRALLVFFGRNERLGLHQRQRSGLGYFDPANLDCLGCLVLAGRENHP